jgi:site-specific DNA-methyltransferase (adenine-specific)
MDAKGLSFFHSVIWDKKNPGMGWRYRRQHEMIMIAHRSGGKLAWADADVKQPNIISLSKPLGGEHPNEKPIELVARFVSLHTAPDHIILDPFMGSGTTGVACANLGRKFIGIEIEPKYFDIACRRITDAYKQYRLFEDEKPAPKPQNLFEEPQNG